LEESSPIDLGPVSAKSFEFCGRPLLHARQYMPDGPNYARKSLTAQWAYLLECARWA
jgi:hypothetical protein